MGNGSSKLSSSGDDGDLCIEDCLQFMMRRNKMLKVSFKSNKHKTRKKHVILDEDKLAFRYEPTVKGKDFKIPIFSLKELRWGSDMAKDLLPSRPQNNQFMVEYQLENDENIQSVGFATFSRQAANIWIKGLKYLIHNKERIMSIPDPLYQPWLREAFENVDIDKNGALSMDEIAVLMLALNIQADLQEVKEVFQKVNVDGSFLLKDGKLTKKEFADFFKHFNKHKQIEEIYKKYVDENKENMSIKNFREFLEKEQLVIVDKNSSEQLLLKYERSEKLKEKLLISSEGFASYLLSEDNDLLDKGHLKICQDMSQPLSHYYISSSHNTYLMEDQLRGPSSVQAYINALKQGCRCVELDIWDGDANEPVIYHGHTWTSKILFKDVIKAVNEYAFFTSDYPLILSFENHCSLDQQKVMVKHLKNILKDKLLIIKIDEEARFLPSPESLKGKIIVKGKKLPPKVESLDVIDGVDGDESFGYISDDENEGGDALQEILSDKELRKNMNTEELNYVDPQFDSMIDSHPANGSAITEVDDKPNIDETATEPANESLHAEKESAGKEKKKTTKKNKKAKLAAELSLLVNWIQSVHFPGFEKALKDQFSYQMSSLVETKFINLAKTSSKQFCLYNKKFLTRTYPGGKRIDSSNYNPVIAWNVGCQLVALNFQTHGPMMDLLRGLFQLNGGYGYVLKPSILLDEENPLDVEKEGVHNHIEAIQVSITIISGHLIYLPNNKTSTVVDPYVTLNIYGVKQDSIKDKFKTKTVKNNGFNPVWRETFQFKLHVPDLTFIRFAIYDSVVGSDDFMLQYTIPFPALRAGYRRAKLLNIKGELVSHASLLVHVSFTPI